MDSNDINTSSQIWEDIMKFTNQAPQYLDQIKPFMGSLDGLFKTKDGKEALSHIFQMFNHVNQFQLKKNTQKSSSGGKKAPPTLTGNHFYDLFNSPGMHNIVKEVMATKGKGKRKKRR